MNGRVALALPVNLRISQSERHTGQAGGARVALTLVEVILVLTLLVIIGAVTVPLLEGTLTRSRLGNGGDLLQAAWARARLAATQSGQTYAFHLEPRGSRYEIIPLAQLTDPAAAPQGASDDIAGEEDDDPDRLPESSLPSGVTFASLQVTAAPQLMSSPASDAAWSAPILFHPDGTTSDAVVILANEEGLTLRVTLRGLTGTARNGEISSEAVP
jgi:hypothetical protein